MITYRDIIISLMTLELGLHNHVGREERKHFAWLPQK